ncbi:MAG: right-handed parallel beta-helix repeat-containing protein, partial [Deltaproteobacteria bacterium]|nr:right-handed parallel beta-helix repeat-containing protein [Deltaproteobacteria bacterium]
SNNTGGAYGGALFRTGYETEPSIFDRCTVDGNSVPEPEDPEHGSGAGGLYIQGTHVTITASTISNNAARAFGGVWILGHGPTPAVADLTNVTINGNYTWPKDDFTTRGIGGGLIIGDNTTGTILNCTITGNEAQFASGIARVSPLEVNNTIIHNLYDNEWCPLNCTGSSYASPPGSGEHNLQWPVGTADDMDCTTDILRADPLLEELADNGGPTATIAPLAGSPALEAGYNCPETDQRGEPRSEPCTIGAYEAE